MYFYCAIILKRAQRLSVVVVIYLHDHISFRSVDCSFVFIEVFFFFSVVYNSYKCGFNTSRLLL